MKLILGLLLASNLAFAQVANPNPGAARGGTTNRSDANGNPIRVATKTGHVSNYDESKVAAYTLPDPLVLSNGQSVKDAQAWFAQRRPEILKAYETEIYGRVPANAPKVKWEVAATDENALGGTAVMKRVVGKIGQREDGPKMNLVVYTPKTAKTPVPVVFTLSFFGANRPAAAVGRGAGVGTGTGTSTGTAAVATRPATRPAGGDPITEILARGWGYATIGYTDIQPDNAAGLSSGVIGVCLAEGQTKPAPDEWGTISAWSWGVSRIVDYFETDSALDAKKIAIMGHSRLGKTVLWAAAQDQRIAAVFSSCSGEMGASLARRDWGETVDDMAQNFGYQFAGNLQKYAGHWNEMPVDSHMLISLIAPRPVFVNGGTTDQWADPKGEFLALVAAGPVYRLLGNKDLGTTQLPPLDTPLIEGDLGWVYHTGGHLAPAADWKAFLDFAGKYFH